MDWKTGFHSELHCGPICIPVPGAGQSSALAVPRLSAVSVPQPCPCRRSSSQTSALLRHGLIVHQTVEVQTLIMQESAGHQPKISGPQLELVIPLHKPSGSRQWCPSPLRSGCASCRSIFSLLVWLFG